ncbi:MAG: hypothetical protein U9N63_03420 [Pseudomonadota bacterium]|nr:hypothetical protein [Pseudomonadota bacterium]
MPRSKKWNWRYLLLLSIICLLTATSAFALDLEMSVGSGYDDNPRLEKGSEGAAFTEAEINIWWTLPLPNYPSTSITLLSFANYQLYDGLDDNWQLGAGVVTSTQLPELPCRLEFFSDIAAYRNPLVDDNEFDNLSLGSRLIWFAGSRLNLEFEASLSWEDYCRTITPENQRNGGHSLNGSTDKKQPVNQQNSLNPHNTGQPKHHNSGDRSDRLVATALKAFYAFTPYLDGGSEVFWRHRHSSIDAEKRSAYGLGVNLNWHPTATLEFIWALSGERLPYKYDYRKEERTEKIYTSEIIASWRRGSWSISGAWNWSKRDSVINEDDYRHNLWQGRLTYSY